MYKPLPALGKKCNLNSTNLKRLNTHSKLAENLGKKVQKKEGKIGKCRIVKRRKTTEIEQSSVQSVTLLCRDAPSFQLTFTISVLDFSLILTLLNLHFSFL
jgi:hypothetical protein